MINFHFPVLINSHKIIHTQKRRDLLHLLLIQIQPLPQLLNFMPSSIAEYIENYRNFSHYALLLLIGLLIAIFNAL